MWLLRWKKPSELSVNTETALPPVPTSHGGIERKVVAEGLQGGEAHHVGRPVDGRARLGAPNGLYDRTSNVRESCTCNDRAETLRQN